MWVILLEAFAALAVLGAIVWWTMFAGRHGGERRQALPLAPDAPRQAPMTDAAGAAPAAAPDAAPGNTPPPP